MSHSRKNRRMFKKTNRGKQSTQLGRQTKSNRARLKRNTHKQAIFKNLRKTGPPRPLSQEEPDMDTARRAWQLLKKNPNFRTFLMMATVATSAVDVGDRYGT